MGEIIIPKRPARGMVWIVLNKKTGKAEYLYTTRKDARYMKSMQPGTTLVRACWMELPKPHNRKGGW